MKFVLVICFILLKEILYLLWLGWNLDTSTYMRKFQWLFDIMSIYKKNDNDERKCEVSGLECLKGCPCPPKLISNQVRTLIDHS